MLLDQCDDYLATVRRRSREAGVAVNLVFLLGRIERVIERIRRRGRDIETGITPEYLSLLESFYEDWLQTFDLCPVLTIRTDDLDFVHQSRHMDIVVKRIQDTLAGKEEVVFTS